MWDLKKYVLGITLCFMVGCQTKPVVLFENINIGDNLETCLANGTIQNNPDYNIKLGTYYLAYLSNKFNDTTVVLCSYNAGEGVVKSWLNDTKYSKDGKTLDYIPYKQTQNYVQNVIQGLDIYAKKLSKN